MVGTILPVKKGLSSPAVTTIPDQWSKQWFKYFIDYFLANADIRNSDTGAGVNINTTGGINVPPSLTLSLFTATTLGAVPGSGGGTVNFLRADGSWATPAGSAAIPNNTVLGNVSGGVAAPSALNQLQLTALINPFTASLSGAVPASSGGTTTFLRADAAFAVPPTFTSLAPGYVPASGGGTTNFLRADGNFAVPTQPTGANPTGTVGLSAVNGVATTFLRSDGAPALSQAINPTWSALHTFSAGLTVSAGTFNTPGILDNSTVGHILTIANTGTVAHSAPSSGIALTVNGAAAAITTSLISALGTGQGADLRVARAGSTINTAEAGPNIFLEDTTNLVSHTLQTSGGQFELWRGTGAGPTLTQMFKILTTGGFVLSAPSSGTAFSITNVSGTGNVAVFAASDGLGNINFAPGSGAGGYAGYLNTNSTGFQIGQNSSGRTLDLQTASTTRISIGGNGNVTISVPSSGDTLTVAPSVTTGALIATNAALTNNAGASAGTLNNAPAAGNPTKWIKINDNGTIRSIPAW